ncbi:IPTL-CTERM sorting domain-containing protein [Brevundimonas sp.]|uniref:IPTL-CTERM sorting domain-containing protein n=1 Tax=Brevundimonas sp. TaxID=1871086 RepID=UPI003D0CA154
MSPKFLASAAAAALIVCSPAAAQAANLVTNGGFTTNTAGWTIDGASFASCTWTSTAGVAGATANAAVASAGGPSDCYLYQTVTLPAATANTLTVSMGVSSIPGGTNHFSSLEIRSNTGALLQTLYTRDGTQGAEAMNAKGPYNLNAYAGQTIRVAFRTVHNAGVVGQQIDNVVLDSVAVVQPVPTLSEWAMILLGTLLAGGAALQLQRRKALIG